MTDRGMGPWLAATGVRARWNEQNNWLPARAESAASRISPRRFNGPLRPPLRVASINAGRHRCRLRPSLLDSPSPHFDPPFKHEESEQLLNQGPEDQSERERQCAVLVCCARTGAVVRAYVARLTCLCLGCYSHCGLATGRRPRWERSSQRTGAPRRCLSAPPPISSRAHDASSYGVPPLTTLQEQADTTPKEGYCAPLPLGRSLGRGSP